MRDITDPPYPIAEIEKQREQLREDLQHDLNILEKMETLYENTKSYDPVVLKILDAIEDAQHLLKRELDRTHEYEPKELI